MMCNKKSILIIFISCVITIINGQYLQSLLQFMSQGGSRLSQETKDVRVLRPEYDFIIIGAGTAGCALANRLTENPNWNVLLIEAGRQENLIMDIPAIVHYLQQMSVNWKYKTERSNSSCLAMENNQCNWPRGKVMGGSSVLNYMIYTRGNRKDYDNWERLGNPGWGYRDVFKYFKKLENSRIPDRDPGYAGVKGPVTISYINSKTQISQAFMKSGIESGARKVDYNGKSMIGYSYLQTTIKDGIRDSSNVAYLYPIRDRPNLHVKKMSHVTNILIDRKTKTATGVRFTNDQKYYSVRAKREVIISAGAINSPQILMLSGIGPANHLREMGIKSIVDLPVGYNLQDHTAPGALTFLTNVTSISLRHTATFAHMVEYTQNGNGPISIPGGCESVAFFDLEHPNDPNGYPDLELLQLGGSVSNTDVLRANFGIRQEIYDAMFEPIEQNDLQSFMVFPMVLRPKSRGRILLRSKNPFHHPIIRPNYFTHPYDMDISIKGIKKMLELIKMPSFRRIGARLYRVPVPQCRHLKFGSDAYWECYTRHFTFTIYHHAGTCKMGPDSDPNAVVDSRLRVRGIRNLRVIDASIMPDVVAGHTNGPTYMIAERGADFIKEDWNAL